MLQANVSIIPISLPEKRKSDKRSKDLVKETPKETTKETTRETSKETTKETREKNYKKGKKESPVRKETHYTPKNVKLENSDHKEHSGRNYKYEGVSQGESVSKFRQEEKNFLNKKRNFQNDNPNYCPSKSPIRGNNYHKITKGGNNNNYSKNNFGNVNREFSGKPPTKQNGPGRNNGPPQGWECKDCPQVNFLSRTDCFRCRSPIYQNLIYKDLPVSTYSKGDNFIKREGTPVPYNPNKGTVYNSEYRMKTSNETTIKIFPKPIESNFSYPEISNAIEFLKSIKAAKNENEKARLICNFNNAGSH